MSVQNYLVTLTSTVPSCDWLVRFTEDARRGQPQITTCDDSVVFFVWLLDHLDLCVPELNAEATKYSQLKANLSTEVSNEEKKNISMSLAFRGLTRTQRSTSEYNSLAKFCCYVSRMFVRNLELGLSKDVTHVFYGFGQTADCSFGGSIPKYIWFKEELNKLVWKYK